MHALRGPASLRRRVALTVAGFGALALVALIVAPTIGNTPVSLSCSVRPLAPVRRQPRREIFFVARLPRVLAAALVGSALALAGVVFQALLRNPLASPDTLGVSAGASLGAMLAITFNADITFIGLSAGPLASFAGSLGNCGSSTVRRDADAVRRRWCCCLAGSRSRRCCRP